LEEEEDIASYTSLTSLKLKINCEVNYHREREFRELIDMDGIELVEILDSLSVEKNI
jgi:hypothetical protein